MNLYGRLKQFFNVFIIQTYLHTAAMWKRFLFSFVIFYNLHNTESDIYIYIYDQNAKYTNFLNLFEKQTLRINRFLWFFFYFSVPYRDELFEN